MFCVYVINETILLKRMVFFISSIHSTTRVQPNRQKLIFNQLPIKDFPCLIYHWIKVKPGLNIRKARFEIIFINHSNRSLCDIRNFNCFYLIVYIIYLEIKNLFRWIWINSEFRLKIIFKNFICAYRQAIANTSCYRANS